MHLAPVRRADGTFGTGDPISQEPPEILEPAILAAEEPKPKRSPGRPFRKGQGGRPKGSINKIKITEEQALALYKQSKDGSDLNPGEYLMWVMRNPRMHPALRVQCAIKLRGETHAQKKDVTHHDGDLAVLNEIYRAGLARVAKMHQERKMQKVLDSNAPKCENLDLALLGEINQSVGK